MHASDREISTKAPCIGIVIVEYRDNRGAHSLLHQISPSIPVVVVSTGPDPFVSDSRSAISIHAPTNPGFGAAANIGIRALPPVVTHALLCNTDLEWSPSAAQRLGNSASAGRFALLSPVLLNPEGLTEWNGGHVDFRRIRIVHERIGHEYKEVPGARNTDFVTGACMMISRAALHEARGFREDFFLYSEDVDLSLRLKSLGWRLGVAQDVTVIHHRSGTVGFLSSLQLYLMTRNGIRVFREWGKSWWARAACWIVVPLRLLIRTIRSRRLDLPGVLWILRGTWDARGASPHRLGKGRSPLANPSET